MTKAPPGRSGAFKFKPDVVGEGGYQVCVVSAGVGRDGSSRTTGRRNAWERGEEVRCVGVA
jgi:hypothetical protein